MTEQFSLEKSENKVSNIIDKIYSLGSESSKESNKDLHKHSLEYLPFHVKETVLSRMKRLESYGKLTKIQLDYEKVRSANEAYAAQVDSRFNISNKNIAKAELKKILEKLFSQGKPKEADFNKVGRLSFDLDGLGSINNLTGGFDKGDKYLRLVVSIFRDEDNVEYLKKMGMEAIITVDGGDEFGIILKSEFDLSAQNSKFGDSPINFVVKIFKEKIKELKVQNLIDFESNEIKNYFEKFNIKVPENYVFKPSISGGGTTLLEVLKNLDLNESTSRNSLFDEIIERMFVESDSQMSIDKENGKMKLEKSENEEGKFDLIMRAHSKAEMKLLIERKK